MSGGSDSFDFLIVGAGSAGCALARRLSEDPRKRVLLLEAGGTNRHWAISIPAALAKVLQTPGHDWCYKTEPDPSRGGKVDLYYRGKGLGGSSSINGMVYVRGAPSDFDRWAAAGNEGWDWDSVEPVFREMERVDRANVGDAGGPLSTRKVKRPHPTTSAFLKAAAASGFPILSDYNGGAQEGVSLAELTQRRGIRHSAADAFLRPVLNRPNLEVRTDCSVERLLIENGRAAGVLALTSGKSVTLRARHTVLSAGSINTPKLLMLSGIGDAGHLRSLGIQPVLDNPHVGKNLREHPLVRLQYATNVPTFNNAEALPAAFGHLLKFLRHGEGPISGLFEAVGFFKSRPSLPVPDLQLHFLPIAIAQDASGKLSSNARPGVSVYINKSHPRSSGEVKLSSADPEAPPLIRYNLVSDDEDVEALVEGMAIVQSIMASAPIADVLVEEIAPGFDVGGERQRARDYVRANTEPAYHPIGTCAMGAGNSAVVDPKLRVLGLRDLSIADASILPDLISGNTNAVCMMIGDRLGRWLLEETR